MQFISIYMDFNYNFEIHLIWSCLWIESDRNLFVLMFTDWEIKLDWLFCKNSKKSVNTWKIQFKSQITVTGLKSLQTFQLP